MTIKTKLILNVLTVAAIIVAVAGSSFFSIRYVKGKLQDLTQRSTPFQMRTVELQRAIQGATADLVRMGVVSSRQEFAGARSETEKSLSEVKQAQEKLESLGGTKLEADAELSKVSSELTNVTEDRLKALEETAAANKAISERLAESAAKLKEMDKNIRGLQNSASVSYSKSMEQTKTESGKVRNVEALRVAVKDYQIAFYDIQRATRRKSLAIAQTKVNTALSKASQNEFLMASSQLTNDLKALITKTEELVKIQEGVIGQTNTDTATRDSLMQQLEEAINSLNLAIEQEVAVAGERYQTETGHQGRLFSSTSQATDVLVGNSELVSLGLTIESLSTRLFIVNTPDDVTKIEQQLVHAFNRVDSVRKGLEKTLGALKAPRETAILKTAAGSLANVRTVLFAADGVLVKVRNHLSMEEKSKASLASLREIVRKQADKGKQSVTAAQSEQELSIVNVNRVVGLSSSIILAIGGAAIIGGLLFGVWMYRSISRPLADLLTVSRRVAEGDLSCSVNSTTKDEIGAVLEAVGTMVNNLKGMVGRIARATETLAKSSGELSSTASTLEKGASTQANLVYQSATAITEMSQTIEDVAGNSSETSNAANHMMLVANQGQEAMRTTSSELEKFAASVNISAEEVGALGRQSEQISGVVRLIKDIADQTNLLALNAAIEAARAGDQGRGFAVVADSVRKLAENTTTATEEISRTVQEMQHGVSRSVSSMQQEKEAIGKLLEHIHGTLVSIDGITTDVSKVSGMVQCIAVATEEQTATTNEINHSMETIAGVSKDLQSSCSDISKSSDSLAGLAVELKELVGWFKV